MTAPARIKVMFAIPELDHAGPDRVIFELASAIDRTRFEPMVMVSEAHGYYLARLPADVRVCVLRKSRSRIRDRYPVGRALHGVWRQGPDVVVATLRMIATLGLARAGFPRRARLIARPANDVTADFTTLVRLSLVKHRLALRIMLATLRRADAVVCQSEAMRRDLGTWLGRTQPPMRVIGNPIDVDRVAREAAATGAVLPGSPALISVGRLAPQKGHDLLLRALAELRVAHPGVHLTIFGDGPDRASLEQLARSLELSAHVTFAGFHAEPLPFVRAADLFVLASRYEGFPNAALEALGCGTPIVLTDCPGANSEIVVAGVNGRLAAGLEPAAIARAIRDALAERAGYERAHIRDNCRQRYSDKRIVGAYEALIAEVAA